MWLHPEYPKSLSSRQKLRATSRVSIMSFLGFSIPLNSSLRYLSLICFHRVEGVALTIRPPPERKEITSDLTYQLNPPLWMAFHEPRHAFPTTRMIYFVCMYVHAIVYRWRSEDNSLLPSCGPKIQLIAELSGKCPCPHAHLRGPNLDILLCSLPYTDLQRRGDQRLIFKIYSSSRCHHHLLNLLCNPGWPRTGNPPACLYSAGMYRH